MFFRRPQKDPGWVTRVLDQGEVDIEAHDLQSNLDATMLHDQRPALLVTGDGCQEIHPLGDEFHGAGIRGPSICRRTDGVENRGNALGMIPGIVGWGDKKRIDTNSKVISSFK